MKFCPILPISYLNSMAIHFNSHMILAQNMQDHKYREFYEHRRDSGDYIIMDNGACEGEAVELSQLLELTEDFKPSVVVIPDQAGENNYKLFQKSWPWFVRLKRYNIQLMAVPQSESDLQEMIKNKHIDIIGLSRSIYLQSFSGDLKSRADVIGRYKDCGKKFHLLGLRINPIQEIQEVRPFQHLIISMDSSLPYRIARTGRRVSEVRPYPKLIDFNETGLPPRLRSHCIEELINYAHWVETGEQLCLKSHSRVPKDVENQ